MHNAKTSSNHGQVVIRINPHSWSEGRAWAEIGGSTFDNPYALGSAEAYSWLVGFIGNDAENSAAA